MPGLGDIVPTRKLIRQLRPDELAAILLEIVPGSLAVLTQ